MSPGPRIDDDGSLSLYFNAAHVRRLAEHAEDCTRHLATIGKLLDPLFRKDGRRPQSPLAVTQDDVIPERIPAELWLVIDRHEGIFLQSNGIPPAMRDGRPDRCYAQGCNPARHPDWDMMLAGTSFRDGSVDALPAGMFTSGLPEKPYGLVRITMTEKGIALKLPGDRLFDTPKPG